MRKNEQQLLIDIFGNGQKWMKKYIVSWCDLCDCATIICQYCENSSCNGGGCDKCIDDFKEFSKYKTKIQQYLNKEEIKIYEKCLKIKKHMLESLNNNEKEINFRKLLKEEKLSKIEQKMFEKN